MRNSSIDRGDWTKGQGRIAPRKATSSDTDGPDNIESNGADTPTTDYSDATVAELLYILEEEKLAGDIYDAFYDQTGLTVFRNIGKAEDQHYSALLNQAETLGLDVDAIVFLPTGSYANPDIQALYDDLLAYGSASPNAALEVGVMIETKDIADISDTIKTIDGTRLADVFGNLLDGSENHLEAFSGMLVA